MHKNTHAQPRTFAAFTLGLCWGKCHSVERMFIWRGQIWWLDVAAASPFPFPWRNARLCACACVFLTVMCVVFDWHGTMGDASVPRDARPDVHRIWHCRASGVTGMWQGRAGPKWLFRLHYPAKTLDMPSPISHFPFMVTEPFTIHKWSADCTLPFTQYRLITHRCKLARTQIRQPPTTANQSEELSGLLSAGSGPAAVVIIPKEASLAGIYIATLPSDVSTLAASRKREHLSRSALKGKHVEGDRRWMCH